jgi:hypothetical protein
MNIDNFFGIGGSSKKPVPTKTPVQQSTAKKKTTALTDGSVSKKRGRKKTSEKTEPGIDPPAKLRKIEPSAYESNNELIITDTVCSVIPGCDRIFDYQFHPQSEFFKNQTTYPLKTIFPCNFCGKRFEHIPVLIPTDYDTFLKKFKCTGNFCGFGCAKRTLCEKRTTKSKLQIILLHKLAREVFGITGKLPIAPPSSSLVSGGGNIDPSQHENWSNMEYKTIVETPFVNQLMMISSIKNINNQRQEQNQEVLTDTEKNAFWIMRGVRVPEKKKKTDKVEVQPTTALYQNFLKAKAAASSKTQ